MGQPPPLTERRSKADHRDRVRKIVEAAEMAGVAREHVLWAERVLMSKNDRPLRDQINDLVESTPEIGPKIVEVLPNIGAIAASARTGVAHGGAATSLSPTGMLWMLEVLRWVVRCRLLIELCVDPKEAGGRVAKRAGLSHDLEKLRKALTQPVGPEY
ncbi:HEPN domain-containing protein [Paractinoplanes deccanensis]|uniref:HEPN domain-containing protein n=1 Tax=Paractinoplanes deccanensis TaxID=113561 RepID=UPI0034DAE780